MEGKKDRKEIRKPENDIFAERLKKLRLEKGYKTRQEFATALTGDDEADINSIYRWEHSQRAPSFPTLKKIAAVLGTSVSYLVGEIDYPGPLTPSAVEANRATKNSNNDVAIKSEAIDIPVKSEYVPKSDNESVSLSTDSYFPIARDFVAPYVKEDGVGNLRIFIMNGDSMLPRFKDGDYLLYTETAIAYEPDVVVAVYKSKVVVRGYFREKDGSITLKPLNGEYQDIKTDASDLHIQGIVKARIPFPVRDNGFY